MLRVIVCRDGQTVSDFTACEFADATIRRYLCNGKDMEVKVANELVQDAFVLRLMEEKLASDEVEFYWENVKLEFDNELGLIAPNGFEEPCLHAKMAEAILKLGYAHLQAKRRAEKDGKDT